MTICLGWLTGCSTNKNASVELDSRKTVHPKTPAQIEAIRNNPHIPAAIKAQMLGQSGGPPMGRKGGSGQ